MRSNDSSILRSPLLKALGLVAALALVWSAGVVPAHAFTICEWDNDIIFTYYSDASHTTVVGSCSEGSCPPVGCSGTKTQYYVTHTGLLCEVCH